MATKGQRPDPTAQPRTPSRRREVEKEPTPPSSDTVSSKQDTFSTDEDGETIAPPHPFLAYARRVRSFSSPLKINRARYLLTFVDAEAAQEWWKLMQKEYPESVRESNQLFSFKSDRVPARAMGNPRFEHLRDKWTFRQLDENKENRTSPERERPPLSPKRTKRGSLMRMLSTPSLGTIGEGPQVNMVQPQSMLPEDPFTEPTPPRSEETSIDWPELNRTMDRMMMMMNQTNLRIDALAEQQRTYTESLARLQTVLEENSSQIQALVTRDNAGAISTKNMRSAIEANASHMKTVLERQAHDAERHERADAKLEACGRGIEVLADVQRASQRESRKGETAIEGVADTVQTILQKQGLADGKLDFIVAQMEKVVAASSPSKKSPPPKSAAPTPSAGSMQRLQTAIEQQSAQLAGLIKAQKSTDKAVQRVESAVETSQAQHHDSSASTSAREDALLQRLDDMQTAHERGMADLRRELTQSVAKQMETARAAQTQGTDRIIKVLGARIGQAQPQKVVVQCDHEVAPPPRKMNRELLGYVYKRGS